MTLNNDKTDDDMLDDYIKYMERDKKRHLEANSDLIETFKNYSKSKGLVLSNNNFDYIQTTGIVAEHPDLLFYLDSSLAKDKEGLIDCNALEKSYVKKPHMPGYYYSEKYMVMASPRFRRGMHKVNNYAPRFIDLFWTHEQRNVKSYLALDYNRVRINVDDSAYIEMDTWYGAKFNENISQIQDGISKLRPPLDLEERHISFLFSDAHSLDVKWEIKGSIKTFQAEELKTKRVKITKDGINYYPVRYIHAEFDNDLGTFRHFDGAIHYYTENEYSDRIGSDLNITSKVKKHQKPSSEKLFKFNGEIEVETWVEFCSHFYTANPLIIEYFSGALPEHTEEILKKIRHNAQST